MEFLKVEITRDVVTVTLSRNKVNAINAAMLQELDRCLDEVERDTAVSAVVLTGQGKFFSFGFDIPELLTYSKQVFRDFLTDFTSFYSRLFLFPKPVVAALNGHTIAGGCILATACDYRVMAEGAGKIALNEVNLGVSFFAGATEMLRYVVGSRNADGILSSGEMYSPEQAAELGLIDEVVPVAEFEGRVGAIADAYAARDARAFAGMRQLLRQPIADRFVKREAASIEAFIDLWYSEPAQTILKQVRIRT